MDKLKNIEFLRIIFLLSICFMHITNALTDFMHYDYINFLAHASRNGGKAVDAFFILSGFFLIYTFKNSTNILDFIKKKIIRLLPVILFAILICLVGAFFHITKFEISSAVISLSFCQMITNSDKIVNWNYIPSVWYVSVLFWVSLFYFYLIKNFDKKYTNLIIGVITVLSYYIAFHIHSGSLGMPHLTKGIFNMGFLRGFGGIGIGYFLGHWYKDFNIHNFTSNKIFFTILELTLLIVVFLELFILNTPHKYNICIIIYLTILTVLFLLKKGLISQFFDMSWCVFLGKYSYSIYVMHLLIFEILKNTGILVCFGKYCLFPAMIIPMFAGIFTYHFVEAPAKQFLQKAWKNIL